MLSETFVLSADMLIEPVSHLPSRMRSNIGARDGDYTLSRRNSRVRSKVVDASAAELLEQFRTPSDIAHAIARYSRGKPANPEDLLEQALPFLLSLIQAGFLVVSDSQEAGTGGPALAVGSHVDDWHVIRSIQVLDDTEVHLVRARSGEFAVFKMARTRNAERLLQREAQVLEFLAGDVTPILKGAGAHDGRTYLVTSWTAGITPDSVCREYRDLAGVRSRRALLDATAAILRAYARLHQSGVVHGDVHPRNILMDRRGNATIVDFGLARFVARETEAEDRYRGGLGFFFEPELATAMLAGELPPPPSFSGEQYSIAAMLYLLLTGSHYADLSLEKEELLRQIIGEPMVLFAKRGVAPWPDVERLLRRALSKRSEDRFRSVAEFAEHWLRAEIPRSSKRKPVPKFGLANFLEHFLKECNFGGKLLQEDPLPAPSTSLNYGSCGIAYAIYRIACAEDDGERLALADLWSMRAAGEVGSPQAFDAKADLKGVTVGSCSLYHGPAGIFALQAMIAAARGDAITHQDAVAEFIKICAQPCDVLDVTLGNAGALLGCAFLFDTLRQNQLRTNDLTCTLRATGNDLCVRIWNAVDGLSAIGASCELSNLGIAHGWAGLLYATLCWCSASNQALPGSIARRLHELGDCAEPVGCGLRWPWDSDRLSEVGYMSGWCNGSAGYVFLWTAAFDVIGDARYLELAEGAAWNVWEFPSASPNLCCGAAGQAYALLNYYRHCHSKDWLFRARAIAESAARLAQTSTTTAESLEWRSGGLFKGDAALAVLSADLNRPKEARLPMFEREF